MKYSYVIFDLDGTITDPFEGITKAVAYSLSKYGIQVEDRRELEFFIGPPLFDSFKTYAKLSEEESVRAVGYYREYYLPTGIFECELYSGMRELLRKLSLADCKVILATSKPESMAIRVLEHFSIDEYFYLICGASLDSSRTKKADVLTYTLEKLENPDPSKCIMVGDTHFDVEGAAIHGINTIGVSYGYGKPEDLKKAGAIAICHDVYSLEKELFSDM